MLKLVPRDDAPVSLSLLPGVTAQVRPITIAAILAAREAAGKVFLDEERSDRMQEANVVLVRELARRGILSWEGVGDQNGNPIAVSPEAIEALLAIWPAFDAVNRLYVGPALERETEKNEYSSEPAGTSAEAPNTAEPAA